MIEFFSILIVGLILIRWYKTRAKEPVDVAEGYSLIPAIELSCDNCHERFNVSLKGEHAEYICECQSRHKAVLMHHKIPVTIKQTDYF